MVKGLKLLLLALVSLSFSIEILSEKLYTDRDGNVIAEGDVQVEYERFIIKAHRIKYNPRERTVFAEGNVYVRSKDGTLEVEGSEAFLDLKTEEGYFLDAEGRFRKFYFSAERMRKLGGDRYIVEKGEVTTCPPDDKEMKLCFWKAKIDERYVFSYSNSLKFFNVPIGYFPLAVFPVGERRSGLLPPMIGQNSYNWFIYIQPFYWAISEDKDATVTLDFRDKQAKGVWIEYRQAFTENDELYSRLSLYKEPTPPGEWWEGRDLRTFRENRYRAQLELSWKRWSLGLDLPSDPYFFEDIYFSQKERTVPYTLSYITYTDLKDEYLLSFNLRNYYDLTSPDNRRTLNLLPELGFYSRPKKVGPFFINLTTLFTNFYRESGLRSKRLVFLPQVQFPFEILKVQNYVGIDFVNNFYFTEGEDFGDERVSSFRLEDRVPLYTSFSLSSFRFSNTLEFVYTFSPENFDNPQFDGFDQVTKENNMKLRLSSSLSYKEKTFSTLFLEGGYNLLKSYRFPTDSALIKEEILPVRLILSLYPTKWFTLSEDLIYDLNLDVFARSVSSVRLRLWNTTLSGSYVISRDSQKRRLTDQYTLGMETSFRGALLGGSTTRDNIAGKEIYRRIYLGYRGACWALKLDYRRTYYGEKGYLKEIFLVFTIFNLRDLKLPLRRR